MAVLIDINDLCNVAHRALPVSYSHIIPHALGSLLVKPVVAHAVCKGAAANVGTSIVRVGRALEAGCWGWRCRDCLSAKQIFNAEQAVREVATEVLDAETTPTAATARKYKVTDASLLANEIGVITVNHLCDVAH